VSTRQLSVAYLSSSRLLAPQARTVIDVIAECEEVAPETVLLAWAKAKGGVVLVTQVPSSEVFTLSAADAASIDEAASVERDASFAREPSPNVPSPPVVPMADSSYPSPRERDAGFVCETDPGVAIAPSFPIAAASHPPAPAAASRDQSGEDAAPPPYSAVPSPPPRFDRLGVVELGHILTPEELVAWREMDRRRFRWYRFCTRTVLFAIWVYLVSNGMYRNYFRWLAIQEGRSMCLSCSCCVWRC
jgi:hypothetical protein